VIELERVEEKGKSRERGDREKGRQIETEFYCIQFLF
jgi:hypothetical protein